MIVGFICSSAFRYLNTSAETLRRETLFQQVLLQASQLPSVLLSVRFLLHHTVYFWGFRNVTNAEVKMQQITAT